MDVGQHAASSRVSRRDGSFDGGGEWTLRETRLGGEGSPGGSQRGRATDAAQARVVPVPRGVLSAVISRSFCYLVSKVVQKILLAGVSEPTRPCGVFLVLCCLTKNF